MASIVRQYRNIIDCMNLVYPISLFPLLASLWWVWFGVSGSDTWVTEIRVLLSVGVIGHSLIALVGLLIAQSKWARWWGLGVLGLGPVLGWSVFWSWEWTVGASLTLIGLLSWMSRPISSWLDECEHRTRPPHMAVALILILISVPIGVGIGAAQGLGWSGWAAIISSLVVGFWYARALRGAVLMVRLIGPLLLLGLGLANGGIPGWILIGYGLSVVWVGWRKEIWLAVNPLQKRSKPVRFLPEMTPAEVLQNAGLNRKGERVISTSTRSR